MEQCFTKEDIQMVNKYMKGVLDFTGHQKNSNHIHQNGWNFKCWHSQVWEDVEHLELL